MFGIKFFHRTIFRRPHAVLLFLAPFYPSFIQKLQENMSDMYPIYPHQICPALCMWRLEHHRATAETQRQEYYCCLSREKADYGATNRAIPILDGTNV